MRTRTEAVPPAATSINVTTSVAAGTADPDASNNTATNKPSINASAEVALAVACNISECGAEETLPP